MKILEFLNVIDRLELLSFRYKNKKTREEIRRLGEKHGVNLKAQDTSYDPRNEKTDTNRNAADVELINSSVQDIPEAVRWLIFEAVRAFHKTEFLRIGGKFRIFQKRAF